MDGLMMDFPLTLTHLLRRAEQFFGDGEIVTRMPDKSFHRTTYRDTMRRSRQLAAALKKAGLERGDRVATLCWNHHQHHEAYFGIPCGGFVLHTLNLRLHPNDLAYIATHANDKAVIVDRALLPLLESFRAETPIEHVFVVEDSYEELLATADPDEWEDPQLDENEAAAMCFTSGTTGRPRGVVYSHRSSVLHALGRRREQPARHGLRRRRRGAAGRADVPRERVGLPVPRDDAGREARLPRPAPRPRLAARGHGAGEGHVGGGRADDLDGHPRAARRGARQVGSLRDEGDARRRLRRAARDDRGVRVAARDEDRAGLGHDRDVAGRLDRSASRPTSPRPTTRRAGTSRRWPASRSRSSRSACAPATRTCRGTARRWASSRCAGRGSPRRTSTRPRAPTAGRPTAGSAPATSSRSIRAATSRSRTARRT